MATNSSVYDGDKPSIQSLTGDNPASDEIPVPSIGNGVVDGSGVGQSPPSAVSLISEEKAVAGGDAIEKGDDFMKSDGSLGSISRETEPCSASAAQAEDDIVDNRVGDKEEEKAVGGDSMESDGSLDSISREIESCSAAAARVQNNIVVDNGSMEKSDDSTKSDGILGSISCRAEPCSAKQVEDNIVVVVASIGDKEEEKAVDGGTMEKGDLISGGVDSMETDGSLGLISHEAEPRSATQVEVDIVDEGVADKGEEKVVSDGEKGDFVVERESPRKVDSCAVGETSRDMETDGVCLISNGGAETCFFFQEDVGQDSDSMEANGSLGSISHEAEPCSAAQAEDNVVVDGAGNKEEEKVDGDGAMDTSNSVIERVSPRREDSNTVGEKSGNMETDADLLPISLKEGVGLNSDDVQTVEKITSTDVGEGSLVDESRDRNQKDSILGVTLDAAVVGEKEEEKVIDDDSTDKEEKKAVNDDSTDIEEKKAVNDDSEENRHSIIDTDSPEKADSFAIVEKEIDGDLDLITPEAEPCFAIVEKEIDGDLDLITPEAEPCFSLQEDVGRNSYDEQAKEKIMSIDVGKGSVMDESRDKNQEDSFMGVTLDSAVVGGKEANKVVDDDLIEKEEKKAVEDDSAENKDSLIDAESPEKDHFAIVETKEEDRCISSKEEKYVDPKSKHEEDQRPHAEAQEVLEEQEKTMTADVVKKRRGRPSKRKRIHKNASDQKSLSRQKDEENACHLDSATPVGKRRGRPPKNGVPKDHNDDQTSPSKEMKDVCQVDSSCLVSSSGEYRKRLRSRLPKDHVEYVSQVSAKKLKAVDSDSCHLERSKKNHHMNGDSKKETPSSENIGVCASQVASQPKEPYSLSEMLSQLSLVAAGPSDDYSFLSATISFFTDIRLLRSPNFSEVSMRGRKRGRKREVVNSEPASSETSGPDFMQDSYWSDIRLESSPEREPVSRGWKRNEASLKNMKNKKANGMCEVEGERSIDNSIEKIKEGKPMHLILTFMEADNIPSVADLIKIYSPHGLLCEEDTRILRETNRAVVAFRYCDDAEKAFRMGGNCSVLLRQQVVSYRLRDPKAPSVTSTQNKNDAANNKDGNL